jgi:hypothetical protein
MNAVNLVEIFHDSRAMADEVERDRFEPFEIPLCHAIGTVEAVSVGRVAMRRSRAQAASFSSELVDLGEYLQ